MTPQALLNTLAAQGFQLRADGENLELTGPLGRLTLELRQAIRDGKPGLLQLLPVSHEAAERYAVQHESTAPPEGDDWPDWATVREAVATGQPPNGWSFAEQPRQSYRSQPPPGNTT